MPAMIAVVMTLATLGPVAKGEEMACLLTARGVPLQDLGAGGDAGDSGDVAQRIDLRAKNHSGKDAAQRIEINPKNMVNRTRESVMT